MKNLFVSTVLKMPLRILFLSSLSLLLFSCSQEELSPETELSATLGEEYAAKNLNKAAPAPGDNSIKEIATAAGFSELLEALTYVDKSLGTQYVSLFSTGKDQYTVFAPTNQAFYDLYAVVGITDEDISALSAELVQDVLLYHVVEGRRAANSVVPRKNPKNIETLLGVDFSVDSYGTINAVGNMASIETSDISASNGIIHIIDAVILPIEL